MRSVSARPLGGGALRQAQGGSAGPPCPEFVEGLDGRQGPVFVVAPCIRTRGAATAATMPTEMGS